MLRDPSKSPIGLTILVDGEDTDGNCYKAWCIAAVGVGQGIRHSHQTIVPSLLACREQNRMTWRAFKGILDEVRETRVLTVNKVLHQGGRRGGEAEGE